jgi:hypothetical protein
MGYGEGCWNSVLLMFERVWRRCVAGWRDKRTRKHIAQLCVAEFLFHGFGFGWVRRYSGSLALQWAFRSRKAGVGPTIEEVLPVPSHCASQISWVFAGSMFLQLQPHLVCGCTSVSRQFLYCIVQCNTMFSEFMELKKGFKCLPWDSVNAFIPRGTWFLILSFGFTLMQLPASQEPLYHRLAFENKNRTFNI